MSVSKPTFKLPGMIERYLAALATNYASNGQPLLESIIVNGTIRVDEVTRFDEDWGNEYFYHTVYLVVPDTVFAVAIPTLTKIREQLRNDLNRIKSTPNESVDDVFIELVDSSNGDWRKESRYFLGQRIVPADASSRIWEDGCYHLFLSHKAEVKQDTAWLKTRLRIFGISAFVAHEDVTPTKAWQDEIENALASMDGFVALMTENFHESDWTDQEVGYAVARGVPIIAVKLGRDPYGFIGKFQALSCDWLKAPLAIAKLLIEKPRMVTAYIKAVRECSSFDDGNTLAELLPLIKTLSDEQTVELMRAYNENAELQGSYGFNGTRPQKYGSGLLAHLNRLGTRQFGYAASGKIGWVR